MKTTETSMPIHFIIPGRTTWQRLRECRRYANEVVALYPRAHYRIWHGKALRDQICNFGDEVTAAFDGLPSSIDIATLATWCLLHLFGGLVLVPGMRLLAPLRIPFGSGVAAFNDVRFSADSWIAIDTAILWSRSSREEWKLAIDMKVKAWRESPSRFPPDPVILGHAFGSAAVARGGRAEDDQWVGQIKTVAAPDGGEARAFVAPDGTMVALLETP